MPATPTRDRVDPEKIETRPLRRPEWIKVRAPSGETYEKLHTLMRSKELNTVCEEAMCPNLGECWGSGTATFLMLGNVCTRSCVFCDIKRLGTGKGSQKGKKRDLALIVSEVPATVAGMFTTNQVCAAPVKVCAERVKGGKAQAIVVNSGNANACTGRQR